MARLTALSAGRPWTVALISLTIAVLAATFAATHFDLNSDTDHLISRTLPWRVREQAFNRLFHPEGDQIVVVVDGATPELAEQAAATLDEKLRARSDLFRFVTRPDAGDYFAREGLLFQDEKDIRAQMDQLIQAQPFLGPLAADPSLRGLAGALDTALLGVKSGDASLGQIERPIAALSKALEAEKAGRPALMSWRTLISGGAAKPQELRRIVLATPVFDFARLQSGAAASAYIREQAAKAGLDAAHGVKVRLTGPAPLQDEEFATLADRAALIGGLSILAILLMLWMAVRSPRLIAAIMITMFAGLACAAAAGLAVFHTFNVISVAFIPLFVGLGIDFGIQFSVRFRAEQAEGLEIGEAIVAAGSGMGGSLTLAAIAIAVGFLAFAPTAYVGVSQLGVIAGLGMLIALVLNLSLLPALIRLFGPRQGGAIEAEVRFLERLDAVVLGHRRAVIGSALAIAAACVLALPFVRFDFNTLHLKSGKAESVATLVELMKDPEQSPNTIELIAPDLQAAQALARRLEALPAVSEARTAASFVPTDQPGKLAAVQDAAMLLDLTLSPLAPAAPPSDADSIAALRRTANDLRAATQAHPGPGGEAAKSLADAFDWLADGPADRRSAAETQILTPFKTILAQTQTALSAQAVSVDDLPDELKRDWLAPTGQARVSVLPRGDANDTKVLDQFLNAVTKIAPDATGPAVEFREAGKAVTDAFLQAGALSFVAITGLLFAVLRRVRDVAITMAPIILTGLLTLGSCVVIGQPLNFANIIALPLLFGIGVAFHIYFVMAWRSGDGHLLQSSLTRAIFFSALATATGFGALWASSHPGTASMGMLLMVSLVWTLVSALLFQPALMGPTDQARQAHALDVLDGEIEPQ